MYCPIDGEKLKSLANDSSWNSLYYCSHCNAHYIFSFQDLMSGIDTDLIIKREIKATKSKKVIGDKV